MHSQALVVQVVGTRFRATPDTGVDWLWALALGNVQAAKSWERSPLLDCEVPMVAPEVNGMARSRGQTVPVQKEVLVRICKQFVVAVLKM